MSVCRPRPGVSNDEYPTFPAAGYGVPTGSGATGGCSVPQYLHFEAAAGRSPDRHAGQVFTAGGSPNTTCPRRAWTILYGTTMRKYTTAMRMTKAMIAEMKLPNFTSVWGLPDRISTPSPFLLPVKLLMSGVMRSLVKAVIKVLNARATTRPTATTITSPRIKKFLNPLMSCSPIRGTRRADGSLAHKAYDDSGRPTASSSISPVPNAYVSKRIAIVISGPAG